MHVCVSSSNMTTITKMLLLILLMVNQAWPLLLTFDQQHDGNSTCPFPCFCNKMLTTVNCDGKRLTKIPTDLPQQVGHLLRQLMGRHSVWSHARAALASRRRGGKGAET